MVLSCWNTRRLIPKVNGCAVNLAIAIGIATGKPVARLGASPQDPRDILKPEKGVRGGGS
ncbi:hypothetical protein SAMN04488040_0738 [Sulfitobacter marinus]|uniref:Uncharacterized protein n=1 Tax=Sulfitobacter marinus TaxID=394264 RepID=A0A1I6QHT7_9RHOB|nr:hypothetical protein SAMN04488040_0738 [Sulfitobacter marinus]